MNEDDVRESTCAKTPRTSYSMYLWATARGGAIISLTVWGLLRKALAGKVPSANAANCG